MKEANPNRKGRPHKYACPTCGAKLWFVRTQGDTRTYRCYKCGTRVVVRRDEEVMDNDG